jgi:hypothetical protein
MLCPVQNHGVSSVLPWVWVLPAQQIHVLPHRKSRFQFCSGQHVLSHAFFCRSGDNMQVTRSQTNLKEVGTGADVLNNAK